MNLKNIYKQKKKTIRWFTKSYINYYYYIISMSFNYTFINI